MPDMVPHLAQHRQKANRQVMCAPGEEEEHVLNLFCSINLMFLQAPTKPKNYRAGLEIVTANQLTKPTRDMCARTSEKIIEAADFYGTNPLAEY